MKTGCFGQSLSVTISVVLYITVVVNVYNLILGLLNFNHLTKILFGDDFETKSYLFWVITSETGFAIFAIMFGTKQYNSYLMFSIRYWIFGLTFATLFLDSLFTSVASYYLLYDHDLNRYWRKMKTIDWHNEPIPPAPTALYLLIATVCYCAFKMYAAITILRAGNVFSKYRRTSNNIDIERNENRAGEQVHSSSPPPLYEQCILESEPPPPYSVVPKDY